ncbi:MULTISPECIES: hypothetical protein [unclassified Methanoculleus]|uniref:hypothetical protein n=1 Tax=unclassified Methanoculleus TaxID=2619537 RepID=UPI00319EADC3
MTFLEGSITDLDLLMETRLAEGQEREHRQERRSMGTEFEHRRCELRLLPGCGRHLPPGSHPARAPAGRESLYTRAVNDFMPGHMLHLTESAQAGKTLAGARIAFPGRDLQQRLRRRAEHSGGAVLRNDAI